MKFAKILFTLFVTTFLLTSCGKKDKVQVMTEKKSNKDAVLETIHSRKSVRKYVENKPVAEEDVDVLVRAAMAAPSGKNQQPWEILVVDDRETLNQLAEGLPYAKMLVHAPMAIIVCGDIDKSPYWYLDCALASQNILLAAESMDLGAVWTAVHPYEDRISVVKKAIVLPDNIVPLNIIPIGHPKGEHSPKDKYDANKIHRNKW